MSLLSFILAKFQEYIFDIGDYYYVLSKGIHWL